MNSRFKQLIRLCLTKNIPFVSFRLPESNAIQTRIQLSGSFNFVEHIDEVIDKKGFVYAPFHRRTNFPIVFFETELIIDNDDFDEGLLHELSSKPPLYPDYPFEIPHEINKEEYLSAAQKFIQSFHQDFTKAVLSRVQIVNRPQHFDAAEFFMDLQSTYPEAFCHLINIPGAGTWAGASPETLLRMDDKKAHTLSLAGTRPVHQIGWKPKEIEEQNIVTTHIEHVFQAFGIAAYKKEETQDQQTGGIIHRATRFSFDQSFVENNLAGFINELHPTPAVCGMPKKESLDLIMKTEKHNREYYSGYCGVLDPEEKTDLFVNLRCMKILPDQLALYLGGGLTAQSSPEKEWEETVLKSKTLLDLIQRF